MSVALFAKFRQHAFSCSAGLLILALPHLYQQGALASASLFQPFVKQGKECAKQGKYVESERLLEMALQNSEHLKADSPEMLDLYDNLSQAYVITGKLSKAEEYLKKVLELREHAKKKDDMHLFATVMSLGTVYRRQDKFADSEQLYKRALNMFEGKGPIKALFQATVLYALGSLYLDRARPQEAETMLKQALELRKQSFLKKALAEHSIQDSLGRSYFDQGKIDEAEKVFLQALDTARKANDQRSVAFSSCNLAAVAVEKSKYEEAGKLLSQSAAIMERCDGPESNNMATILCKQANLAIRLDRYSEAQLLLERAIGLHKKNLGEKNTQVAYDLSNLVDVLRNQGKYQQAEESAKKSLQIFEDVYGKKSSLTALAMVRLAWVYCDQTKYELAEPLSKEALSMLKETSGTEAREIPSLLCQLAVIEKGAGKNSEAEAHFLEAAQNMEKSSAPDEALLGYIYSELASIYGASKNDESCESSLKKALAFREKVYGVEHQRLLADLNLLMRLYEGKQRADDANKVKARIESIKAKHPELSPSADKKLETSPIVAASNAVLGRPVKDKWALVIGISNFASPEINLKYAAKDATDFANFLTKDARFAPDHVKLLTDANASRDNIIKQLGDEFLGRKAGPDDLVVIYISSHGSSSRSEAGGVNFLVAHDTQPDALLSSGIPMQWLSQIIKEQVHANRVVLIMDVCHSGASSGEKGLSRESGFDISKLGIGEGQAMICSSAPEQISWESKVYPNSVFTRRLIEGLKQNNANTDLNSAYRYLKDQVEAEVLRDRGRLQTPLLFSKSWQGSAPILSVPGSAQAQRQAGSK